MNFDIKAGENGSVFIANFEGLLYYNNAEWCILHTSGLERTTVTYSDKDGIIWVGGYNYFGKIDKKSNGELYLHRISEPNLFRGEVLEIWEKDDELRFIVNDGKYFKVKNDTIIFEKQIKTGAFLVGLLDVINSEAVEEKGEISVLTDVIHEESLGNGLKGVLRKEDGVYIINERGEEVYHINENNGLNSNDISWISYDGHGRLWGSSENEVFSIAVPSVFTHFTSHEGLNGRVLCIADFNHQIYAGTNKGLFRLVDNIFVKIADINYACSALLTTAEGLLASTGDGIYLITTNGSLRKLTDTSSSAILDDHSHIYSGEIDGVYLIDKKTLKKEKVCQLEKVNMILKDNEGSIWLKSTYGEIWQKTAQSKTFKQYKNSESEESISTLVETDGKVIIVQAEDEKPFPYPLYSYTENSGVLWLTDFEGKNIYRWKDGKRLKDYDKLLYPFKDIVIHSILLQNDKIWLGGENGLTIINTSDHDPIIETTPRTLIRSIRLGTDSIIWGGYGDMPKSLPSFDSKSTSLRFVFSLNYVSLVGKTLYRYKLDNSEWSAWADDNDVEYNNLAYGSYTFMVQGRDAFGRETPVTSIDFSILYPFYMRWYMYILYLIIAAALVYVILKLRLRRLEREKINLEKIVEERTAEVKSAQKKLIKQEKMATVGKLTQGLIDRILNPMNYINNFSKLSEGLVKDIRANIENEKDNMDKENYEDTIDVLDMLKGNLQKVGEHGQNTTRTLKAMEEMLKDRSGGIVSTDICSILKQNEKMLLTYYSKEINELRIKTLFSYPDTPLIVNVNPEQLSKVFMSILGNSIYAIVKKAQRTSYTPEVTLKTSTDQDLLTIAIYDTGIGIEEHIINKIFDPFFTTKTTGEASGIGLYLSHEVIQNFGGDIKVRSVKDEFTEFTITLPIKQSAYERSN